MNLTRILFIAESLNVGGAEKALVSILNKLDYSKSDVTLMLICESGEFLNDISTKTGLKRKYVINPSKNPVISFLNSIKIKALYKWLPASVSGNYLCSGYDIVIAFCEGYLTKWVAASTTNCKKIAWVHTDMVSNDWPVSTGVFSSINQEQSAYRKFDNIIAVSNLVNNGFRNKFGVQNITTIYNILDNDLEKKALCDIKYTPSRTLNLVSVGRLEAVKGYSILLEACEILIHKKNIDISLCLVGDGSQRKDLEDYVSKNKLEKHIFFAGKQSNPYPYISKADAYVCSSKQEGFNIAILEAMTLGKPIISTDSAGPNEILENGKYGILTENNVAGLVDAISQLYNNKETLTEFKNKSLLRAKDFDADIQLAKISNLLHS